MSDLIKMIEKNLYLRVDFNNQKTKEGLVYDTKFYLIGVLDVMVFYMDGNNERVTINYPLEVGKDPFMRMLHGVKANERHRLKNYKKKVGEITAGMEKAIAKATNENRLNDREITKLLIIKPQLNAGSANHKNRRDQAICQEHQETSDQTD